MSTRILCSRWVVTASLFIAVTACGEQQASVANAETSSMAQGLQPDYAFEALVASAEFNDRSAAPGCLLLRSEISTLRKTLGLSSTWRDVENTSQWASIQSIYELYKDDHCPALSQNSPMSSACVHWANQIYTNWAQIKGSQQWAAAMNSSATLRDVIAKWQEGRVNGCIQL